MASIGQLAATTPAEIIPVGGGQGQPRCLSLLFYNAHASNDETIEITLTRGTATVRTIFKTTLKFKEQLLISNLQLEDNDQVKAAATDATSVNYVIVPGTKGGLLTVQSIDATGAVKNSPVAASLTLTTNVAALALTAATGQAIPVTASGSLAITQNGAETNTLAIPTFLGQTLNLFVDTDTSGARVITSAQRINQAGNTIITMTEVGDFIRLVAITIAGALRWQVVSNDGCALS